jgi:hypothetical protein
MIGCAVHGRRPVVFLPTLVRTLTETVPDTSDPLQDAVCGDIPACHVPCPKFDLHPSPPSSNKE